MSTNHNGTGKRQPMTHHDDSIDDVPFDDLMAIAASLRVDATR